MSLTHTFFRSFIAAWLLTVGWTCVAGAQSADGASQVQGTGVASLERMPQVLRMQVQVSAKGKSLKEALAALKDRRDAVKAVLPTMGAIAESIKFDDPQVTRGEEQLKMNEMLMERMGRTKRGTKSDAAAIPTTAVLTLSADWPLAAGDVEQLIAQAYELQDKIKAADLGGSKEATKLTPEEEELQAEMQQVMSRSGQERSPGEPQFIFVAQVGADERAKVTAEAFQKSKMDAERLAAAAGAKLGKLVSLQSSAHSDGSGGGYSDYGGANPYYYEMQQRQMQMMRGMVSSRVDNAQEAVGYKPGKVRFAVSLQAHFALQ